jgi:ubiquinone/menaquinone biosynthesis C-methylase UbiE
VDIDHIGEICGFLGANGSGKTTTIRIGCGEGRLTRHLKQLGHNIVGIDASPSLVAAARAHDSSIDVRVADAAALPLEEATGDLAIAFMSLHDIDPMPAAAREIARVLAPGGPRQSA